jgi:hypothetical protein
MAAFPWKVSLALLGTLVIGFGVGIASGLALPGEEDTLRQDLEEARNDLTVAQERLIEIQDLASDRLSEILTLEDLIAGLQAAAVEPAAVQPPPEEKPQPEAPAGGTGQATTFADGIWQVGVDFPPGLYRAPGGDSCYWALLKSANTQAIINNGGFGPNQTLQINSPWFETSDCGEWSKIG